MTSIVSSEGAVELISARRTESLDSAAIQNHVSNLTKELFGRVDVVHLIEKALLAVTLVNSEDTLLGHGAFFDYPNTESVGSTNWEAWLNQHYHCSKANAINSLFMHYFVAQADYSIGCAKEIINTVFNAVPDLHYIYLLVPGDVKPEPAIADLFFPMKLRRGESGPAEYSVHLCNRADHCPVLYIREARVQDHDDLTPIFNRQSNMLRDTYGDYFLAEMIEAQSDEMRCLAAEVDGIAVGFMSVSTDVNLNLLNECFELGPFHGFRQPHPDDVTVAVVTSPPPDAGEQLPTPQPSSKSLLQQEENLDGTKSPESQKSGSSIRSGSPLARPMLSEIISAQSLLSDEERSPDDETSEAGAGDDVTALEMLDSVPVLPTGDSVSALPSPRLPSVIMACHAANQRRFVPQYHGPSKAVCIQLFCIDERYETRSCDFLNKVFQLFPDHDYCLITVPHLVPEFPLLQQFVRVTPKCPSTLAQELYVFHKVGLFNDFRVCAACSDDYDSVEKLVANIDMAENLLVDLKQYNFARRDKNGIQIHAYVAVCLQQVVGIAILRQEEDIEFMRSHYNIEDFIYYNHHHRTEHGHLHHFALNPIFAHLTKTFLKEASRRSSMTSLYYPIYPPYVSDQLLQRHSLITALNQMVAVRPRRQILYNRQALGVNAPSERVLQTQEPYALYHINRKLFLEPKVTINVRIVVVGASDVGVSFLEYFAFCPHLRFNNITLVSPHGLPCETAPHERAERFLSNSLCYDRENLVKISLRTWVNVVYGKMTAIDRHKRHIVVDGGTIVPYDHVILATGLQYQVPCPTEADVSLSVTNSELTNSPDRRFMEPRKPRNVFVINDHYEALATLRWLDEHFLDKAGKALVYGNSLDAYSCVQALLESGMTVDRIVFVQPPIEGASCFNDPSLVEAIDEELRNGGVEVHCGFYLAQWNDGNGGDEVYAVSFTSHTKPIRIECAAFFAFYKKMVDCDAFTAVNDACLVYDGKLVVDSYFHTNDPSIRAAGTMTKYQRKYHAEQWSHQKFNSKEVGMQLACTMLSLFDPCLEPEQTPPPDVLKLIPMYRLPKMQYAVLPGGYFYLHIHKPDLDLPLEVQMSQADYTEGTVLITGSPCGEVDYFRLHVNQYQSIQTITCLAKTEFAVNNIRCLYGLHEKHLNNLVSRFYENLVTDLYEYFNGPWALAIFHDRFGDFCEEIRELMVTRSAPDHVAMEERVRQAIDDDLTISQKLRDLLLVEYEKSGSKRAVEWRLLSFLAYNYYHLPMYARPGMV